ncbi:unnamed protein product [Closterium sp. NIES-65]|nr:unnamed protein product [Closterium sp. NIES-65]
MGSPGSSVAALASSNSQTGTAARQQLMHHLHELRALLAEVPCDAAAAPAAHCGADRAAASPDLVAAGDAPRTPQPAGEQATAEYQDGPRQRREKDDQVDHQAAGDALTEEQQRQRGLELLGALLPMLATASKSAAANLVRLGLGGSSTGGSATAAAADATAAAGAATANATSAGAEIDVKPEPASPPLSTSLFDDVQEHMPFNGSYDDGQSHRSASPEHTSPRAEAELATDEQRPPPISTVRNAPETLCQSTALPQLSPIEMFAFGGDSSMPWCFQQYGSSSTGGEGVSGGAAAQDLMQFLPVRGLSVEVSEQGDFLEQQQQQQQQQQQLMAGPSSSPDYYPAHPAASPTAHPQRSLPLKLRPLTLPESSCWPGDEERDTEAEQRDNEQPAYTPGPASPYSPCASAQHSADAKPFLPFSEYALQDVSAAPSPSLPAVRAVVSVPLPLGPGPRRAQLTPPTRSPSPLPSRSMSRKIRPSASLSLRFTPPATPTTPASSCGFVTPTTPATPITPASPFTPASPVSPTTPVVAAVGGDEAAAAAALPAQLDALLRALLLQKIAAAADAQLLQQQQQQQQQPTLHNEGTTSAQADSPSQPHASPATTTIPQAAAAAAAAATAAAAAETERYSMDQPAVSPLVSDLCQSSDPLARLMESIPGDGYQWRKYGQKTAKGAKFPRAYFRCALPGCPARKTVELAEDAASTRVVYREEHSHAGASTVAAAGAGASPGGAGSSAAALEAAAAVVHGGPVTGSLDSHLSSSSGSISEDNKQQQQQQQQAQVLPGQGLHTTWSSALAAAAATRTVRGGEGGRGRGGGVWGGGMCGNKRQRESEESGAPCPTEEDGGNAVQYGSTPSNPCKRQKPCWDDTRAVSSSLSMHKRG